LHFFGVMIKIKIMKNVLMMLICICLISVGCKSTAYLSVMKPAGVSLGPDIKSVAVVNRTVPENKLVNTIEGILTGEWLGQDKQGVQRTIQGIHSVLRNSPNLEAVIANEEMKGSGSGGTFPMPLSWEVVEELCNKYQVDAILCVETYDSDFIVTRGTKVVDKKDKEGKVTKTIEYYAEGIATVKIGMRVYDPSRKTIVDQAHHTDNKRWYATARSVQDALIQLIDSKMAVQEVSYAIGRFYGSRISPSWIRVSREFYRKPKSNTFLAQGGRRADVGDWQGALESWLMASESHKQKVAGRAAVNVALGYEVLGELDEARLWAMRSFTDYGNKTGRTYANILRNRIRDEQRLEMQLAN
jgi:hypothetical protein